jgi:hypothetical protein
MRPLLALRALVGIGLLIPSERSTKASPALDEVIQFSEASIVDTPTPPTAPRRIDVSRWQDLLRAAELLGRPILRLQGSEGGTEGLLFYVADGPQSYVFGFPGTSVSTKRSGAYAPPRLSPPEPAPGSPATLPAEAARSDETPLSFQPAPPAIIPALPLPANRTPSIPPPAVPERADSGWDSERPEKFADADLPSATVVEQRIREMIHELLVDFRKLPPSSDRLELGTEHIQRAVDMLHLGRYGVAQIELNKAARLLREEPPT